MDISIVADILTILGGGTLLYQAGKFLANSYRYGIVRQWRKKLFAPPVPVPPIFQDEWEKVQRELYVDKLLDGAKEEQLNALKYVKHIEWHSDLKQVVRRLICEDKFDEDVRFEAVSLLAERQRIQM